ncbi:MAG: HEAT repeat domain-containing protein [Kofleriaceae bacterium]|nr:HEAT repeat domain-containing protein [Kofleriaceae bacterium]
MSPRNLAITDAERARIEQVERLVALGPRSTRALLGSLSDPSWTVRRRVVAALAALGDDAAAPLCTWLRDARTDENAIAAAVDALSASTGPHVTELVLVLVDHGNAAVVADAAAILGRRRVHAATPVLAQLVRHTDDNVAVAAIEALGTIGGSAAVEALISVIESRAFFRTFPAIQVLARTGDPRAIPALTSLLADETYRLEVVRALGRTGLVQAIDPIISLLERPSDAVLRLVAVSLAELIARADFAGAEAPVSAALRTKLAPWLGKLATTLRTADPAERTAIATVLGRAGDVSVLPAITAMLEDAETASAANDALQHLGRSADDAMLAALATRDPLRRAAILPILQHPEAAPTVRALLDDSDVEVRARACEALARLRDTSSVPRLFEALGDPSPRVAHAAVAAILALGTVETELLALAAAHADQPSVRRHAIRLLGAFGFPSALDPLRAAIDDPDRRIAELAIVGLGAITDARVDGILLPLAASRDSALRAAVMRASAHRGGAPSVRLLQRGLSDESPWVRYYAAQGLGRLGAHEAPQASAWLVDKLRDPAPLVRIAALEALSRLGSTDAWDAVCRAATSADPDERRAGLVGVGMQAREGASEILIDAAHSPDAATRLIAMSGIARLQTPRALEVLAAAIGDDSAEVRDAALSLLAERDDDGAARALVDWALRSAADHPVQRALSNPGPARIVAILARLTSADDVAAPTLVSALARMHTPAATEALFEALTLSNAPARAAAATALAAIEAHGARAAIENLAANDPDSDVRRICAALG